MKMVKLKYDEEKGVTAVKVGFTMVELSLSLVFIAILSIAVVLVMTGAISSYHRSITLNKVESVGSGLVRDVKASIQGASADRLELLCDDVYVGNDTDAREACEKDHGRNFAFVTRYANVTIGGDEAGKKEMPVFGALCTGNYTYIWNSGYFFNPGEYKVTDNSSADVNPASLSYKMIDGTSDTVSKFKLLKIKDKSHKVCEAAIRYDTVENSMKNQYAIAKPSADNGNAVTIGSVFRMDLLAATDEKPIKYLQSDDMENSEEGEGSEDEKDTNNLAVYDMSVSVAEQSTMSRSAYYYGSFILGTIRGGINVNASGNFCAAPEGYNESVENFDYCAINKFNFAALATGG